MKRVLTFCLAVFVLFGPVFLCTACGEDKHCNHIYGEWRETVAATCKAEGEETRVCEICGDEEVRSTAKTEHRYGEWQETAAATCKAEGEETRVCEICGDEEVRSTAKTEHRYGEWQSDEYSHWNLCKVCDAVSNKAAHIYDSVGICNLCGVRNRFTSGLEYALNSDGVSYCVKSRGTATAREIVIPGIYNGLPVTRIGDEAFMHCDFIRIVEFPDNITGIGSRAFSGCVGLTGEIIIPGAAEDIGTSAFYGCVGIRKINFSDNVSNIGYGAFQLCTGLTDIIIPDKVSLIEGYTFAGCTGIRNITLGNGVKKIDLSAFDDCNEVETIALGSGIESLSNLPAGNKLIKITVATGNNMFSSRDGVLYDKNATRIILCPQKISGNITVPGSVDTIESGTFSERAGLTGVIFENGLKRIDGSAFYNCSGIIGNIVIPDSVAVIGQNAFSGCSGLTGVTIGNGVEIISGYAFNGCVNIADLTIGNGVKSIENSAFKYCNNLVRIFVPDSVTSVGDAAFSACSRLETVVLGKGLTVIRGSAFHFCQNIKEVFYVGGKSDWYKIYIWPSNDYLISAERFYYSETEPSLNSAGTDYDGNYWCYRDGAVFKWKYGADN